MSDDVNGWLRDAGLVHILSISGLHTTITILVLLCDAAPIGPRQPRPALRRRRLARGVLRLRRRWGLRVAGLREPRGGPRRAPAEPRRRRAVVPGARLRGARPGGAHSRVQRRLSSPSASSRRQGFLAMHRPDASVLHRSFAASTGAYLASAPILAASFGRLSQRRSCRTSSRRCCAPPAWPRERRRLSHRASRTPAVSRWTRRASPSRRSSRLPRTAAAIPGGHLRVAVPEPLLAVAYVSCLLRSVALRGPAIHGDGARALRLGVMLTAIALHSGRAPPQGGAGKATIIDVGQGCRRPPRRGWPVRAPRGCGAVGARRLDAGDRARRVPELTQRGCRQISTSWRCRTITATMLGRARAVLHDIEVGELWVGIGVSPRPDDARGIVADACGRGGRGPGNVRRGDGASRAEIRMDRPPPGACEDRHRSMNDRCLVLCATTRDGAYGSCSPATFEAAGEAALLAAAERRPEGGSRSCAAHHGAKREQHLGDYLARGAARIVSRYRPALHNRVRASGAGGLASGSDAVSARVLRTDRDGTISLLRPRRHVDGSVERRGRHDEGEG